MKSFCAVVLLCISTAAVAQQSLEIIALKHRTADQVVDALRPLLEPGGTLTGQGNQLIVRTSPANLAEIQRALDAIDRQQRRLQISVRFDADVELRAGETDRRSEGRVDQRVQALDGGRATIFMGQSRPVRQRQYIKTPAGVVPQEVTVVQETTTGFEVIPRVSGRTVTVDIVSTNVMSTASGLLGEWFELGAVASPSGSRRVSVKVDALD
jgi:hypothetical protein